VIQIIIGGTPEPIGEGTGFLRRLLHGVIDRIDALIDFYPCENEPVRAECREKIVQLEKSLAAVLAIHAMQFSGMARVFLNSTPQPAI